ncbi:NUDIX domain-containing protein [Actinomadura hibisca]|uniref:NUDIX domain-containing protein n=1 Tax=Actinomadura hibisca TaxID=68565 RepID=UPI00082D2162|nr:NUDIX domain-containing protein [Actinomadura hibisca]
MARTWTGADATALRRGLGLTIEAFARRVGVAARTVDHWAAHPQVVSRSGQQAALDRLLAAAPEKVREQVVAPAGRPMRVVARAGMVLLVRRRDEGPIGWQFPAGVIKPGEDGGDVAVQETHAETGVHCAVAEHLGCRVHPVTAVVCDYYVCSYLAGRPVNRDPAENTSVAWAPIGKLTEFVGPTIYPPILTALEECRA